MFRDLWVFLMCGNNFHIWKNIYNYKDGKKVKHYKVCKVCKKDEIML